MLFQMQSKIAQGIIKAATAQTSAESALTAIGMAGLVALRGEQRDDIHVHGLEEEKEQPIGGAGSQEEEKEGWLPPMRVPESLVNQVQEEVNQRIDQFLLEAGITLADLDSTNPPSKTTRGQLADMVGRKSRTVSRLSEEYKAEVRGRHESEVALATHLAEERTRISRYTREQ